MDKKTLQTEILENSYQPEKWVEVLKQYFSVKVIHQQPRQINLPNTDLANTAFELGSFFTADERLIGIYEVELTPKAWIERNRVTLRNLLRNIYKYDVDGALIVFVQNEKWRFSYVSEIRTEDGKKETEPKRYTYLFGKDEICRTAADRFDKLKGKPIYLNDLYDAFSVEKLNKEFFKSYKEFFESFSDHLARQSNYRFLFLGSSDNLENGWKDDKAKPIRDFTKKLLGRIVFLQFLQKKGWMGVPASRDDWSEGDKRFLQNLFLSYSEQEHFHSKALKTLFFETLNRKREDHIAPSLIGNNIKIPYLNGGLFDKDISYENNIDFPVDLFKNLLDFFETYNFTIDENDPYDSEVGIDPEMLGHIFENLLEENREKGAFYTPKEIVLYMCQESLIEYLHTQFPDFLKEDFEMLVRNNQVAKPFTNFKTANGINDKLKDVKICDPAIGSGAFPMGLLKEIYECRRLLYSYLRTSEPFIPATVKKEIIQHNIYGVDIENGAVEIARLRFWLALVVDENVPQPLPNLDYKIMQGHSLLESFEGVDLSNLADMDKEETFLSASHGQLEIGAEFSAKKQTLLVFDQKSKDLLYELIDDYYNYDETSDKKYPNKQFIKNEINKIVEGKLIAKFYLQKPKIEKKLSELKSAIIANKIMAKDSAPLVRKKEKNIEKLQHELNSKQKELDKINNIIQRLHELQILHDKPYFLWHLWFKEVFDKGGFDIVIGNPPFIQLQSMTNEVEVLEAANFDTFTRTGDIYCLFYEQGNNLLKPKGTLCLITSNKWMNAAYGKNFRKYLLKNTNPKLLIDFSKTVIFPAAVVFVNILLFTRDDNNNVLRGVKAQKDFQIGKTPLNDYVLQNSVLLTNLNQDNWAVVEKQDFEITNCIDKVGTPLKNWNVQFFAGIKTAMNPAFHIDAITKLKLEEEDKNNSQIIKPLLRGKDIKRWAYHFDNLYLINSHNGIREKGIPSVNVKKDYPAIYQHLLQYYDKDSPKAIKNPDGTYQTLKDRADQGEHWTNLRNCAFLEEFEKEKIIWIEISDRANYCLDTEGRFLTNSAYFLTGENLKYLLAVLNSRLMDFYFFQKTAQIAGGRKRYTKQYVELLPIPKLTDKALIQKFETIVDYIIYLNDESKLPALKHTPNIRLALNIENVLNMMVFELYFEQHMKENDLDVLQFIKPKPFVDIFKDEGKERVILDFYYWLQTPDNPIRQRINIVDIKSPDILSRINASFV